MYKDVVVLGTDHYNPLWVVRSLGMAGFEPTLIVVHTGKHSYISKSKYVKCFYLVPSENDAIDLLKHLSFSAKTVVVACSDKLAEILDCHYDELSGAYYIPNCYGKQGMLTSWMNKEKQQEAAQRAGLKVLESIVIKTKNINNELIGSTEFPCIIKPLMSSRASKNHFRICNDHKELRQALSDVSEQCEDVIIQKYIRRDYEFNILGARVRNRNIVFAPGGYYRTKMCTSLRNLGMPCYGFVKEAIHEGIDMAAWQRFVNEVDYEGLFSTEFLISGKEAYFLEINLRDDGDLFYWTTAGVNLPALLVSKLYGQDISQFSTRFVSPITYGMNEVNYVKYQLRFKSIIKNIRDWWRCNCYTIFEWRDLKPFLYKFIYAAMK